MTTLGYIRVSCIKQNIKNQRLAILEFANKRNLTIDDWIQVTASTFRTQKTRKIDELLSRLDVNDTLIVSELSRLGRSIGQVTILVDQLVKSRIKLISIKENIELNGKQDIQQKIMITMFALFSEIEQNLISERTKEGLARAKAKGKRIGRPPGTPGKSKLDGKEKEIKMYLDKRISKSSIARIYDVSWPCVDNFIKSRGIYNEKCKKRNETGFNR